MTAGPNGKASSYKLWNPVFLQVIIKSHSNLPWVSKPIIQAMRKRNSLFCAAKRCSDSSLWAKSEIVRNKVLAVLPWSKAQYFYPLKFATLKEFWRAIK